MRTQKEKKEEEEEEENNSQQFDLIMANSPNKGSTFAHTCSLLRQFMKEGRSLGDLGLGINSNLGKSETHRPPTTMSLLPGVDVSGEAQADTKSLELFPKRPAAASDANSNSEPEKAQLTIFYGGKVLVFDNFPADKADGLMQMAGKQSCTGSNVTFAPPPSEATAVAVKTEPEVVISNLNATGVSAPTISPASVNNQLQNPAIVSNLPIQSTPSLRRFFVKRKERINARAPYQVDKDSPVDSA